LLLLWAARPMQAQVMRDMDFMCGSHLAGHLNVTASDTLQFLAASTGGSMVVQCPDGKYTANAGMRVDATATAAPGFNGDHFAWMQALTVYQAPQHFANVKGNGTQGVTLTAPWPDTPPGGYYVDNICGVGAFSHPASQTFDNEPWYGNNTIGQRTLFDLPS